MYLYDWRITRTLKHVVRPGRKKAMNSRSLSYLRLALHDKRKTVIFATFPKSGWNWSADILNYSITKHFTGEYRVAHAESGSLKQREQKPARIFSPADSRSTSQTKIRDMFPGVDLDYCLHTHGYWKEAPLWGLDAAKTVMIVRNIPTTLYSYFRSRGGRYATFEECLRDGALDRIINFYNSWGDFCALKRSCYRIYRYEDLRCDSLPQFRHMFDYVFDFDVGDDLVGEALACYSFKTQKQREWQFSEDETKHFYFRGALDYFDLIGNDTLNFICQELTRRLTHRFGYSYPAVTLA